MTNIDKQDDYCGAIQSTTSRTISHKGFFSLKNLRTTPLPSNCSFEGVEFIGQRWQKGGERDLHQLQNLEVGFKSLIAPVEEQSI
jgi:hypothetical protein